MSTDIFNVAKTNTVSPFGLSKLGLRQGFNEFVGLHPQWLVYVRRDLKYPCTYCYDPTTKSPDPTCQECYGLGYVVQYEKHACRRVITAQSAQSPIEPFGYLSKYRTIIYEPRYYYPKSKDVFLEVEWDTEIDNIEIYGKPITLIHAYQVDEQVAFQEDEVTYIGCGCDTYDFNIDDMEKWLRKLGQQWEQKIII